jgi:hypothetical protein
VNISQLKPRSDDDDNNNRILGLEICAVGKEAL